MGLNLIHLENHILFTHKKIFSNFKDINPKDLLFVGDTIYTDIQLAEENNIKNCLVLTGSSSRDTN